MGQMHETDRRSRFKVSRGQNRSQTIVFGNISQKLSVAYHHYVKCQLYHNNWNARGQRSRSYEDENRCEGLVKEGIILTLCVEQLF